MEIMHVCVFVRSNMAGWLELLWMRTKDGVIVRAQCTQCGSMKSPNKMMMKLRMEAELSA